MVESTLIADVSRSIRFGDAHEAVAQLWRELEGEAA